MLRDHAAERHILSAYVHWIGFDEWKGQDHLFMARRYLSVQLGLNFEILQGDSTDDIPLPDMASLAAVSRQRC